MNKRKEEHTCSVDSGRNLKLHIEKGIERVLRRKRFGFEVIETDQGILFDWTGDKYFVSVSVLGLVVVIEVMIHGEDLFYEILFSDIFPVRKMHSINKIGTMIANKVKGRMFVNVMEE